MGTRPTLKSAGDKVKCIDFAEARMRSTTIRSRALTEPRTRPRRRLIAFLLARRPVRCSTDAASQLP